MKHGSLFSGIGGFDLASEWMGWENVFHCEWMEFPRKVLDYYWPNADSHIDICKTDFKQYANKIDILTGGFPCQPFSLAGKRKGTDDERYLWGEMLRAIQEIKPKYVIAENVYGITNIDGGMVFEQVCLDLEAEGYEVQPFIIPASAKNAPHQRLRCWFVAKNTNCDGWRGNKWKKESDFGGFRNTCARDNERVFPHDGETKITTDTYNSRNCLSSIGDNANKSEDSIQWEHAFNESDGFSNEANVTDPNGNGFNQFYSNNEINTSEGGVDALNDIEQIFNKQQTTKYTNGIRQEWGMYENKPEITIGQQFNQRDARSIESRGWENFPTQSPLRKRDDGVSDKLLNFVVNDFYDTISYTSKENRIENLQEVQQRVFSEEVWEKVRGLYSLESKTILLKTMQLYSTRKDTQIKLSPFSKEFFSPILQHLQKHGEFRCSPQGQELQKQRNQQFGNSLSFLPHEVALAAKRFEAAVTKFESWHSKESIKGYGNAIVPQVAYEIFKNITNE